MPKPTALMIGAYPEWDMEPIERGDGVRKLWLAQNKETLLDEAAPQARAISTRGERGTSSTLIDRCPQLEPHQPSGAIDTRKAMRKLVRDNLEARFSVPPLLTPVV